MINMKTIKKNKKKKIYIVSFIAVLREKKERRKNSQFIIDSKSNISTKEQVPSRVNPSSKNWLIKNHKLEFLWNLIYSHISYR